MAIRQGNMLAVSFHPELSGDGRLHAMLLAMNGGATVAVQRPSRPARAGGSSTTGTGARRRPSRTAAGRPGVGRRLLVDRILAAAGGSSESLPRDSQAASAQAAIPAT